MSPLLSIFVVYLAIFLFGMIVMRTGLYNLSHKKLQASLYRMTDTTLKGLVTGAVVTALLQSSSAVMVLTIGLIASGYLTFKQSIGIILGTNIGTTVTAEMITLDLNHWIVPLLLLGAFMLFLPKIKWFSIGCILFGLGCIFTSMYGFEQLATPLANVSFVKAVIAAANQSAWAGVLLGTVLTAIIQSSSAATGIIMSFLHDNTLTIHAGTAIILGANIGTCITAFIASIGSGKDAKLAAYTHIWLNLFGVILFIPFIPLLAITAANITTLADVQLAHVSLIFNVVSSLIALPFAGLLGGFVIKVHGRRLV